MASRDARNSPGRLGPFWLPGGESSEGAAGNDVTAGPPLRHPLFTCRTRNYFLNIFPISTATISSAKEPRMAGM